MRLADLSGRSVAVWGTGPEGRAALRAIVAHAPARLIAVDDTAGFLAVPWDDEPAPLAGGDHAFPALVTAEVVVRSAEVPAAHPWLAELHERGVAVTSGNALWMADHAAQTIAVTGGEARCMTARLIAHLLTALGRPAAGGAVPLLGLPTAEEYVVELPAPGCADLTRSPRVAVVTALAGEAGEDAVNLLRHGPEMIVVDGTDLRLRDAIRGRTDLNGFPPIPAAAEDSRFRIEDGQVFCSDEPIFPREALRRGDGANGPDGGNGPNGVNGPDGANGPDDRDGRALCVALAVLDGLGLGVDVLGNRDELRAAVESFEPGRTAAPQ